MDEEILPLVFAAVTSDAALTTMLQKLAKAFDCRSAAIVYADRIRPNADITIAIGPFADTETRERYYRDFVQLDPAPAALGRLPTGQSASTDLLFLNLKDRYSSFLQDFYYPLGLAGALGGPIAKADNRIGMIAIHRGPDRDPFDEADIAKLDRIMPALVQMLELRRTFFELADTASSLRAAIEPACMAILILDERQILRQANAAARKLLARGDGIRIDYHGSFLADDPNVNRELQAAIALKNSQRKPSVVRVPRAQGQRPIFLRLMPRNGKPGVTVYASDPDSESGYRADALMVALGVTPACADLVQALLKGETLESYGTRRGISKNTVKYHLNTVFAATNTHRQSELILYASKLIRDLGF